MILGLQVITGFQANKPTGYPANTVATFGGGLFMRRYWQLGKAVYLFGQADAYGTNAGTKQHDGGYTYITKDTRFGLSVYPGAMYAVTRHFQLEAALGDLIDVQYRTYSYKYKYNNSTVNLAKQTTFVASSTLNGYTAFTLGFRFLL